MFDEILGLPAHPLIIHAAVVLTPLLALMGVVFAVLPRFQPSTGWAVVALAILAPIAVFAAKQSGEALNRARFATVQGDLANKIMTHSSFANPLLFSTIGLSVSALLMVFVPKGVVKIVFSVTTVVLAAAAGYYVFRAGDSGAQAVWGL